MYAFKYSVLTFMTAALIGGCARNDNQAKSIDQVKPAQKAKSTTKTQEEKATKATLATPKPGNEQAFFSKYAQNNPETMVLLKTRLGNIKIQLFDDTPIHRGNFLYNIKEELYYSTIFYRVVPNFMIQGGNSDYDKTVEMRELAGAYYIPNESSSKHLHTRGAVAMAMSYEDNPGLKSAQYSYYIVIGTPFQDSGLDAVEKEYGINISTEARELYKTVGGTPHLDGKHTVFGRVVKGMEVVEAISNEKRDSGDWPVNDVVIEYEVVD